MPAARPSSCRPLVVKRYEDLVEGVGLLGELARAFSGCVEVPRAESAQGEELGVHCVERAEDLLLQGVDAAFDELPQQIRVEAVQRSQAGAHSAEDAAHEVIANLNLR